MTGLIRVLVVEDSATDAKLVALELRSSGHEVRFSRVEEEQAMREALQTGTWDLVISDWSMPKFSATAALRVLTESGLRIPFIIVSGTVGEDVAVEAMRAGARDFILKDKLTRLGPAVDRELKEALLLKESESALRRSEEQLQLTEARFRALIEKSADLITVTAADGTVLYVSPAINRTLGREPVSLLGTSIVDLIYPEDQAGMRDALAALLEKPAVSAHVELRALHVDGSIRWLDATGRNMLADPSVNGIVSNFRDVTERKLAEVEQAVTQERLRQAQKMDAIGRLAGGVAHDFNNLLTVILTYSRMLAEDLTASDPRSADLEQISAAANRAVVLTSQLLAFGRQQLLQPRIVNLNDVVTGIERMLRRVVGDDIEMTVSCRARQGKVRVDPGPIEQVIMNLVVNARDAMPDGGKLTIETGDVELDDSYASQHVGVTPGKHVMLAVTDTGCGMDRATQARIFEPFFTTKERGKGTGFGLAIVFGIVQQSGGYVWVYSEVGIGTTFKVYFPLTDQPIHSLPAEPEQKGSLRGAETVLLVEDDDHVRAAACAILRRYGYDVLESSSSGDALLVCEQHPEPIELVITDVVMPRMSGRQLAERLLALRPSIKVIFMSGYTDDSIIDHGVLDPGAAFIQKPISPEPLARKIRSVLDAR
jgi:PAS domain S-box-containing protein